MWINSTYLKTTYIYVQFFDELPEEEFVFIPDLNKISIENQIKIKTNAYTRAPSPIMRPHGRILRVFHEATHLTFL
jgi:hypothetical protein